MMPDFQLCWHTGEDYPEWGSSPRKPLVAFDGAHKGEWLDSVIGPDPAAPGMVRIYHVVRCELCIAIHVWPLPEQIVLDNYYAEQFYQRSHPDYMARYETDRTWWEQCVHSPILEGCARYLRLDCPEEGQVRFLDIGAGPGIALDCGKGRHWQTYGIEPNEALCQHNASAHTMLHGTLASVFPPTARALGEPWAEPWHIIYLYEVLEHQPCPEEFLLRCYDLLMPGGVLTIVVPNDYNPLQLQAQARHSLPPWWLSPPEHLFYWTPKTLQLFVRRCGLSICDLRGTYPIEQFLLDGDIYVGNDQIGRTCHQRRMQAELRMAHQGQWLQCEAQYRANLRSRVGREIICIARKEF